MKRDQTEYQRIYHLKYKYGLTIQDYDELLDTQGGVCAICSSEAKLVVDHDHATDEVRGLLCHSCNLALGHLQDDPKRIQRMLEYL